MDSFQGTEPTPEELAFVARSYAMRQMYWPSYTWQIQTEHLNKVDVTEQKLKSNNVDVESFNKHRSDLFDKINASFYHLQKLKENEEVVIALGKQMADESKSHTPVGVMGIVGMPYEPINYEYEALLVTLKSGLDIISMMLAQPSKLSLNVDDIGKLLRASQDTKKPNEFLAKVKAVLTKEGHTKTIAEFMNKDGVRSKRNHAVHQGSLPTGTINIQFAANNAGLGILKTRTLEVDGNMGDVWEQQNLDDYATSLFYAVCDLIIEGLELLVGESLPRGEKMSIYEARLDRK